jgi:hypothetical protein
MVIMKKYAIIKNGTIIVKELEIIRRNDTIIVIIKPFKP